MLGWTDDRTTGIGRPMDGVDARGRVVGRRMLRWPDGRRVVGQTLDGRGVWVDDGCSDGRVLGEDGCSGGRTIGRWV